MFKKTHGMSGTPTYNTWNGMMTRCYCKKHNRYHRYGGRGIKVCDKWHKFENFLHDMGERPEGKVIDRIDNDGNYEPGNCRWVSHYENCLNRPQAKLPSQRKVKWLPKLNKISVCKCGNETREGDSICVICKLNAHVWSRGHAAFAGLFVRLCGGVHLRSTIGPGQQKDLSGEWRKKPSRHH